VCCPASRKRGFSFKRASNNNFKVSVDANGRAKYSPVIICCVVERLERSVCRLLWSFSSLPFHVCFLDFFSLAIVSSAKKSLSTSSFRPKFLFWCNSLSFKRTFGSQNQSQISYREAHVQGTTMATCYFHMWKYQFYAREITWYFTGVYIINTNNKVMVKQVDLSIRALLPTYPLFSTIC